MYSRLTNGQMAGSYWARKTNRLNTSVVTDTTAPAWGAIDFTGSGNPSNGSTVTINGTVITFGTTVTIGGTLADTLAATAAYILAHPISGVTVSVSGNGLTVLSTKPADTSITLAASAATVSASHLQVQQVRARNAL